MDNRMPDQLDREPEAHPAIGCLAIIGLASIIGLALVGLFSIIF